MSNNYQKNKIPDGPDRVTKTFGKDYFTEKQLAGLLGYSREKLQRDREAYRGIKFFQRGSKCLYSVCEVHDYINRCRVNPELYRYVSRNWYPEMYPALKNRLKFL